MFRFTLFKAPAEGRPTVPAAGILAACVFSTKRLPRTANFLPEQCHELLFWEQKCSTFDSYRREDSFSWVLCI